MRWVSRALALALVLGCLSRIAVSQERGPLEQAAPAEGFSAEQLSHWSYQAPKRLAPPDVKERNWPRNAIDRFILAGLEELGFSHAPEADRVSLVRRVTFDLTGLPPTPEDVQAFLHDSRPDAYERLVDRLLASPHYGERWAQHWLDLAHYADSNGFELDAERPDAWRYRDWVVAALNADMPYDRFVTLQLAGDEAAPDDESGLIATGFGRSGPREVVGGNVDPLVRRQSELTEVTSTVGSVFLGLTVGCARCHDHKFDAIPTTDYYRLQAFFAAAELLERPIASKADAQAYEEAKKALDCKLAPLKKAMTELEAPYREVIKKQKDAMLTPAERAALEVPAKERTPAQKKVVEGAQTLLNIHWEEVAEAVAANPADHARREDLKRQIEALQHTLPRPPAHAMALVDARNTAPATFVLRRGDPKNPGPKVEPRPPGVVLASMPSDAFAAQFAPARQSTLRRLALARWITRPDNPLTARVIVNRLWQHHFGKGIVATPSDFGVRGEEPTHPELLDWLACTLVDGGWRLKSLHRLIVTSATYRQSSSYHNAEQQADDPENTLLWRMNRRRMEAESLRDAMLAVSGQFNPEMGGPGVLVPIEKEVEDLIFTEAEVVDLWPESPDPRSHSRRSLYMFRKRNVRYPLFDAFDAPDTQTPCPQRAVSTHALQPLVLMNSDFATGCAKSLAGRLFLDAAGHTETQVIRAYRLVLAREPRPAELAQGRAFLASDAELLRHEQRPLAQPTFVPPGTDPADAAALVDFALAMLNRNEFVYVP